MSNNFESLSRKISLMIGDSLHLASINKKEAVSKVIFTVWIFIIVNKDGFKYK